MKISVLTSVSTLTTLSLQVSLNVPPEAHSACSSVRQLLTAPHGISQFHKRITVEILSNLLLLLNICTSLKGPPPSAHFHNHSLIAPPITDPFGPSVPSGEMNGPGGTKGPEYTANSNYRLQTALTPLGCSSARMHHPYPLSQYCHSG